MLSLTIPISLWSVASALTYAVDIGSREHRRYRRCPWKYAEQLAAVERDGQLVLNAQIATRLPRMRARGMAAFRLFLIFGFATILLNTTWPAPIITWIAAVTLTINGGRGSLIIKARGYRDPSAVKTRIGKAIYFAAYLTKIFMLSAGFTCILIGEDAYTASDWVRCGIVGFAAAALIWLAHLPSRLILRYTSGWVYKENTGFGLVADQDSILLLRSFVDDQAKIRTLIAAGGPTNPVIPGTRERFEELVAFSLLTEGRLVACGRPGERLPELGAVRTYYPSAGWQDAVRTTAIRSMAIIIIAGTTEALSWELKQVKQWGLLEKTLVLLPPERDSQVSADRLRRVQTLLGGTPSLPEGWTLSMWVGLTVRAGKIVYVVSDGRDWASYLSAILLFLQERAGNLVPLDQALSPAKKRNGDASRGLGEPRRELNIRDSMAITRALNKAGKAILADETEDALALYEQARDRVSAASVPGAKAMIEFVAATDFYNAGRHDEALRHFKEVVKICGLGLPVYRWLGRSVRPADIKSEALEKITQLAVDHGLGDPMAAHQEWFEGLIEARSWEQAGTVADIIARNIGPRREIEHWFGLAEQMFERAGNKTYMARSHVNWGKELIKLRDYEAARAHLRSSIAILEPASLLAEAKEARELLDSIANGDRSPETLANQKVDEVKSKLSGARSVSIDPNPETPTAESPAADPDLSAGIKFDPATTPPTAWWLGEAPYARIPEARDRPEGIQKDGHLRPRQVFILRGLILCGYILVRRRLFVLRGPGVLEISCYRLARRIAIAKSAHGAALMCTFMEANAFERTGRHHEAIHLYRQILSAPEPGWIIIEDRPRTGVEFFDSVWSSLEEIARAHGDYNDEVEARRNRRVLASRLRDAEAMGNSAAGLAYALSRSGRHDEAEHWFNVAVEEAGATATLHLNWAANALALSRADIAAQHLESAQKISNQPLDFPSFFGINGDVAWAKGDSIRAIANYRRGMAEARSWHDGSTFTACSNRIKILSAKGTT